MAYGKVVVAQVYQESSEIFSKKINLMLSNDWWVRFARKHVGIGKVCKGVEGNAHDIQQKTNRLK